ncbi:hypothetical protein LEN26_010024 [Aphanomyces euteiches]|nr:hypothetical protein AeMF1_012714 [Aphanomyces euteiches]KAH9123067.1 hypothetical protein LEN26_010024 [Aphanomyces euteiches]KAH9190836.1 hypothetical protein AeNC1_007184 [Aphanomyces euteiches]
MDFVMRQSIEYIPQVLLENLGPILIMLTLLWVVASDGTPLPVEIAADQVVGQLKKMEEIDYNGHAKDLQLYLALKDYAWLTDVDPDLEVHSQPAGGNAA